MTYTNLIKVLNNLKKNGVPKSEALDCLEFDSDEYPIMGLLNKALDEVYG